MGSQKQFKTTTKRLIKRWLRKKQQWSC